jgi:hypothetical protein
MLFSAFCRAKIGLGIYIIMNELRFMSLIRDNDRSKKWIIIYEVLCKGNELVNLNLVVRVGRWCDMTVSQGNNLVVATFCTNMWKIRKRVTILDQSTT